ncbi:MAG: MarR family transcriptional regulator [Ilumatobacteraceae bacterium]
MEGNLSDVEEIAIDWVARVAARWTELRPDLDPGPMLVIGRIQRIAALVDAALRPPFAEVDLADGDFDLLAALRRQGPPHSASPGHLTGAMLVTSGATSKRIDRLEVQGYVVRRVSTDDGRGRVVTLTSAGLELVDGLMTRHMVNEAGLLGGLTPGEQTDLAILLGRLAAHLEHRKVGASRPD